MVVEAKEKGKDDVGDVAEPESGQELLSDTDGGHELSYTKDETPPLSGAELTKKREGKLSQDRACIDRGTKSDEATELVANFGANAWAEGKVHGTGALRVAYVGELGIASGSGDIVDEVAEIEGKLLETPSPEARVGSGVLSMTSLEVGADVGDPDVKALIDEPESHGALFVDDKMG